MEMGHVDEPSVASPHAQVIRPPAPAGEGFATPPRRARDFPSATPSKQPAPRTAGPPFWHNVRREEEATPVGINPTGMSVSSNLDPIGSKVVANSRMEANCVVAQEAAVSQGAPSEPPVGPTAAATSSSELVPALPSFEPCWCWHPAAVDTEVASRQKAAPRDDWEWRAEDRLAQLRGKIGLLEQSAAMTREDIQSHEDQAPWDQSSVRVEQLKCDLDVQLTKLGKLRKELTQVRRNDWEVNRVFRLTT